ncbi:type I-E CRISPR-associated endonuclease Cas1e [Pseudoclavibacter caeni]|uniref:CRISPR-associated endonuclease Cas1 n=1 Tax=Pseudoclavibacter caeni TaxID=908846 RepID=A0A7C8BQR8_9MICO|nr:type I-E CRISPR-associated endonuclease Cas1e [Pseudoclavibacter caeni]KAB1631039.1 type I-E CRISPR-associated endonuclease Cas1 [Pseudoclavibacter caeni]NYJ96135.1 CRISPR-associated protein Cas1 [Pseudoclavibacter caeni]
MADVPGVRPPEISELLRARDRLTFIYVEHCVVNRDANAVTATDARGTVHIPAATLGCLLLGPGTTVTHAAMSLLAESRSTCVWVGEQGVRYYCHGATLARSTKLLEAQARLVSTKRSRMKVARAMYAMRFPGEDTTGLTMQQLLGKEGTRVRRAYAREAQRTGVQWQGRSYKVTDFDDADAVNQALSAVNTSLYGVIHSVIVALGCSPGLGFVHTGNDRSFVYDIADLYKVELTIPLAFDLAAAEHPDIGTAARRAVRDQMRSGRFMERCVRDIRQLLLPDAEPITADFEDELAADEGQLWAGGAGRVAAGRNYGSISVVDEAEQ